MFEEEKEGLFRGKVQQKSYLKGIRRRKRIII